MAKGEWAWGKGIEDKVGEVSRSQKCRALQTMVKTAFHSKFIGKDYISREVTWSDSLACCLKNGSLNPFFPRMMKQEWDEKQWKYWDFHSSASPVSGDGPHTHRWIEGWMLKRDHSLDEISGLILQLTRVFVFAIVLAKTKLYNSRKSVIEDIFTYVKCSNILVFYLNSWRKVQIGSH